MALTDRDSKLQDRCHKWGDSSSLSERCSECGRMRDRNDAQPNLQASGAATRVSAASILDGDDSGYAIYDAQEFFDRLPRHGLSDAEHRRDCEVLEAVVNRPVPPPAVAVEFRRDRRRSTAAELLARPILAILLVALVVGVLAFGASVLGELDGGTGFWLLLGGAFFAVVLAGAADDLFGGVVGTVYRADGAFVEVARIAVAPRPTFVPASVIVGGSRGRAITKVIESEGWELAARSSTEFFDALAQVHLHRELPSDIHDAVTMLPDDQAAQQVQAHHDHRTRVAERVVAETIAAVEEQEAFVSAQHDDLEQHSRRDRAKLTVDQWIPKADSLDALVSDENGDGAGDVRGKQSRHSN